MKTYKEMADSVFERSNEIIRENKRKKKIIGTVSCCFVAALLGAGVMKSMWKAPQTPPVQTPVTEEYNTEKTQETAAETDKIDAQTEPARDLPRSVKPGSTTQNNAFPDRKLYYVNPIINTVSGAPLYRDPKLHYKENWDNKKTAEYFEINLSNISPKCKYIGAEEHTVTFKNDGTLVEDRADFAYNLGGGKVIISSSKLGVPYDCIYKTSEDKTTNVSGVDILMMGKEYSANGYELLVADFEFNGVYYRVIGENVDIKDFHTEVIMKILNHY